MPSKTILLTALLATVLVTGLSFASGYSDNTYTACFSSFYTIWLCPFNVIQLLPEALCLAGFIISFMRTKSLAVGFLSAAIVSYLVLLLFVTLGATTVTTLLAVSTALTVAWIGAFAYELYK